MAKLIPNIASFGRAKTAFMILSFNDICINYQGYKLYINSFLNILKNIENSINIVIFTTFLIKSYINKLIFIFLIYQQSIIFHLWFNCLSIWVEVIGVAKVRLTNVASCSVHQVHRFDSNNMSI